MDYTISDHHPVVAVFQCPSPILLSQPPLPPCIFQKLSSDKKQQFSKSVRLISDWCRDLQDAPARAPLEEIMAATDSLLMQVGSAYHKITRPKRQRKDQEGYGKLRKLLRSPPPPSSPAFPEHIAEVQSVVNTLQSSDETKAKRKLHSSLVRGVQMKSTVARTLCPKDLEPLVVRDPATKELLSDPADVAKDFWGHPASSLSASRLRPRPGLRRRGPVPLAHMPRFCQERPHTSCDLAGVPEPLKTQ